MPTYSNEQEEYDRMKKELKDLLAKKRVLDRNLNNLEENIYKLEGTYLEETSGGNIVKGFDNYVKGSQTKRRVMVNEDDRIFSMSSAVFLKVKMREEEQLD